MTKGESAIRNPKSAFVWLFLAAAALTVYFAGLTMPLLGPDEPRYAQVAREMFERGDWVTPTLGGFHWFEKPALLYWLQIASYNLFGVTEFAARFGSALFGLGTIAALWILGRQIEIAEASDENVSRQYDLSKWLALIAASTIGIIAFAHGASFDIILTFPMTAALVSFIIYDLRSRVVWLVSFYFFIGVAILAKGLVGIVFPFAIVGFYHVLVWKLPSKTLILSSLWGVVVAALVAATWYVPMYLAHGGEFIDEFFIQHHFQRYTSNKYLHPQPFHFFFWVLPLMTIPWLPFFIAAVWRMGKEFAGKFSGNASERQTDPRSPVLRFAVAWIIVPLVFFSFSGSKLPGYILPAIPATIILTAGVVDRFVRSIAWRTYLIQAVAAATFLISLIALFVFAPRFAEADSVKSLFATAHARNLDGLPVITMHRASHNAEFYATGPILREPDGKQKRLPGPHEVVAEMKALGQHQALVIIPPEYIHHLQDSDLVTTEILKGNEESTLTLVTLRDQPSDARRIRSISAAPIPISATASQ